MQRNKKEAAQGASSNRRKRLLIIFIPLVVVVLLSIAGVFYYQTRIAPFKRTVLAVDNTTITMDYFLKRVKWANSDPSPMLEQLTYEQIVNIMAVEYGISVSDSQVDHQLRVEVAYSKENTTDVTAESIAAVTDSELNEWYSAQLKTSGLADLEYREVIRTDLLAAALQNYLANLVPTQAEQVHLYINVLETEADANNVIARINAGESFAAVAREVSVDESREKEGEVGWVPRGVTPFDDVIFQLDVGRPSKPVKFSSGQYAVFFVTEIAANREIADDVLQVLKSRALYTWLEQEIPKHTISNSLDEKTLAWVNLQLANMSK